MLAIRHHWSELSDLSEPCTNQENFSKNFSKKTVKNLSLNQNFAFSRYVSGGSSGGTKGGRKSPAQQRPATKSLPPPPVQQQQIQDIPQQAPEQPQQQEQYGSGPGETKGQRPQAPVQQQSLPQAPVKGGRSPSYQQPQQQIESPQQGYGGGSSGKNMIGTHLEYFRWYPVINSFAQLEQ